MIEGIDLSSNQPVIDAEKIKAAGITFAFLRVTDGVGWEDPKYRAHAAALQAAGVALSGYHYNRVRHFKPQDAAEQAKEFCGHYEEMQFTISPAIDCEPDGNAGTLGSEWLDSISTWCETTTNELGRMPFIYTYEPFWDSLPALKTSDLVKYPLFIANYNTLTPPLPKPWTDWALHQYEAGAGRILGHVDGVPGVVDRDRFRGTIEELCALGLPQSQPDSI